MKEKNITISDIGLKKPKGKNPKPEVTEKPKEEKVPEKKKDFKVEKKSDKKKAEAAEEKAKKAKIRTIVFAALFTIIGLAIGATLIYSVIAYKPVETSSLINHDSGYLKVGQLVETSETGYPLPNPSEPRTKINPLNGLLLTASEFKDLSDRRPVAVMVNNHAAARPQTNLSQADIVYEALVESGITRYMPVYWQNAVTEVGPIRSARQYYLEWLSEYDAIYIHDGYASGEDPRIDAGGNIWRYGIKSISTQGAWRDPSRVAPHNEYSSVANAMNIGEQNEWTGLPSDFDPWNFKNDAPKEERGNVDEVSVTFHERLYNAGLYDVKWVYDSDSNSYLRYIANNPDIDLGTDNQIRAKVVVLQEVNYIPTYDAKAHIILETEGTGDATILMDGDAIDGKWKKESRTQRTIYYDNNDNELSLNRGLIWITAVAKDVGSFDIIEQ